MSDSKRTKAEQAFVLHDNSTLFQVNSKDLCDEQKQQRERSALLILNNPKGLSKVLVSRLWEKSHFHVCADGGSNWLFDAFEGKLIPDLVHGDLDSMRPEVGKYFESKGALVTLDRRDDATDLDKCLTKIAEKQNGKRLTVFVAGVFGARFDHEMGNLNSAYSHRLLFDRLVLVAAETYGEILEGGDVMHKLIPDRLREGPICGMIPLFGPCQYVDTTGLRWNMEGRATAFGKLVSTSNEVAEDEITIRSDGPLLWTTTLDLKE